jgi:hypothetical protein
MAYMIIKINNIREIIHTIKEYLADTKVRITGFGANGDEKINYLFEISDTDNFMKFNKFFQCIDGISNFFEGEFLFYKNNHFIAEISALDGIFFSLDTINSDIINKIKENFHIEIFDNGGIQKGRIDHMADIKIKDNISDFDLVDSFLVMITDKNNKIIMDFQTGLTKEQDSIITKLIFDDVQKKKLPEKAVNNTVLEFSIKKELLNGFEVYNCKMLLDNIEPDFLFNAEIIAKKLQIIENIIENENDEK